MIVTLARDKDYVGSVNLNMFSGSAFGPDVLRIERGKKSFNSSDSTTGVDDILVLGRNASEDWRTSSDKYNPKTYRVLAHVYKSMYGHLADRSQIKIDPNSLMAA